MKDLPEPLLISDSFLALGAIDIRELKDMISWLKYISDEYKFDGYFETPDMISIIDNLELDLYIAIGRKGSGNSSISPYIIHSSWTFSCQEKLSLYLQDSGSLELLRGPSDIASVEDAWHWLNKWATCMNKTTNLIWSSTSYCSVIGAIICCNALVSKCISAIAILRLSIKWRSNSI